MSRFTINTLNLQGLKLIIRQGIGDERGFLFRIFCAEELAQAGWMKPIAQINHTYTQKKGTVRGMHFQHPPHSEMKLVTCLRGAIFDVAIDLRQGSPTFLSWHAERISAERAQALLIPEGFAHGFQALSDDVELLYCHSAPYASASDDGLNPLDPMLAIAWPEAITELSTRDRSHPMLPLSFEGLVT
jgi:dTDP-4-dehydrorhamnose 3,5-epimerase